MNVDDVDAGMRISKRDYFSTESIYSPNAYRGHCCVHAMHAHSSIE
jgi:hypothetical protein